MFWSLFGQFLENLDLVNWSPRKEVNTSPPTNIKIVIIMSWELENTSISIVDMLETVVAETDVKNTSESLGLNRAVLGFETIKAR